MKNGPISDPETAMAIGVQKPLAPRVDDTMKPVNAANQQSIEITPRWRSSYARRSAFVSGAVVSGVVMGVLALLFWVGLGMLRLGGWVLAFSWLGGSIAIAVMNARFHVKRIAAVRREAGR